MDLRVAAYAVITDDDGRVLLSRWIEGTKPTWTMPGGGMDPGEHPEDTARREVREETGYDVAIGEVLGVDSFVIPARKRINADAPLQALRIVYRARIVGGHLTYEIDGSTDMAEWFPLDRVHGLEKTSLVGFSLRAAGLAI